MARRRGGGGKGRSRLQGSSGGGSSAGLDRSVEDLVTAFTEATQAASGFATHLVEGSDEFKRAKSSLEDMVSRGVFPAAEALASAFSPGAGSFVENVRRGLGQITAQGNAGEELSEIAAQSARRGVRLDKKQLHTIYGLLEKQDESVEEARQLAGKVAAGEQGKAGVTSAMRAADALGITDLIEKAEDVGSRLADKFEHVVRSLFGGAGR